MLAKMRSVAFLGIEVVEIMVEVNVASRGFPGFDIVGLPAKVVSESKQRVKTALINSGIPFPSTKKITVNLAPADLPKNGSMYDMPIAVGIMKCVINSLKVSDNLYFGELSLDGTFRHTQGAMLVSLYARQRNTRKVYVSQASVSESSLVKGVDVIGVTDLGQLKDDLSGIKIIPPHKNFIPQSVDPPPEFSMNDIQGQEQAKRALDISAAGLHNIFLVGPPGVGKTMLAKAFTQMLTPLKYLDSVEVTKIYSILGLLTDKNRLISRPPFRNPHHTITLSGMLGGGNVPKPGEVSLAHRGVLFLDEFTQFGNNIIESLRVPMEEGVVNVSKNKYAVTFPAKFLLIAACNPCPCGYYGSNLKKCRCTLGQINQYRRKISGPIMDRFDLFTYVSTPDVDNFKKFKNPDLTYNVDNFSRITNCREVQEKRYIGTGLKSNSDLNSKNIRKYCTLSPDAEDLLNKAYVRMGLSMRSYFKVVKVARTIADFDNCTEIQLAHIAEALQYKSGLFSG